MKNINVAVVAFLTINLAATPALADPCGMVPPPPPLEIAATSTIERIGVQKTYVAFDDGVETMVLRPGFQGNVEEFGMLIPFPSPPAIRKVDDNIFSHIAAAIDPPEVIARVQRFRPRSFGRGAMSKSAPSAARRRRPKTEQSLRFDEVKVVKQEAVGMYEVAVLAAGSPKALKRWMDDNKFRYPKGMDDVVEDYVRSRWYFVAVKTKVGQKAGVNPRPGMRAANSRRPAGSTFSGFVQAMGFRFRSKELVVPMRLSVFNSEGNARNIVYVLTDRPTKIRGIPEKFVVRQIPGKRLYHNVTNPLPLRVIGGTKKDLSPFQIKSLPARRNPTPHNGLAKDLFAADMLAMRRNRLSNPLEEKAKAMLNIGETLGLRGRVIDDLNRAQLKKERDRLSKKAIRRLQGMTLTIVDGAFDRRVLAKQNLRFSRYRMAKAKNSPSRYDANRQGPGFNRGGKLYRWEISKNESDDDESTAIAAATNSNTGSGSDAPAGMLALAVGLLALGAARPRKRKRFPAIIVATLLLVSGSLAYAQHAQLARRLSGKNGTAVVARLATSGDAVVPDLLAVASAKDRPVAQGRAILALVRIGSAQADAALARLVRTGQTPLVRTWAASGRMQLATNTADLYALESLSRSLPATRRPWVKRLAALLATASPDELLTTLARVPELRAEVQGAMGAVPATKLIDAMLHSKNMQVRQQAASFLGTKGERAGTLLARALRFRRNVSQPPWRGGPLYLPAVPWRQNDARRLASNLLRWMLWAENRGDTQTVRVVGNNLMSPALAQAAGYKAVRGQLGYSSDYWVGVWTKTYGSNAAARIINDVGQ